MLHSELFTTSGKPVMLSHTKGFSDPYILTAKLPNFPKPPTELFDPDAVELAYCKSVIESLTICLLVHIKLIW